jgi:hypothetical protein
MHVGTNLPKIAMPSSRRKRQLDKARDRFTDFVLSFLATFAGVILAFGLEKGISAVLLVIPVIIIVVFAMWVSIRFTSSA